MNAWSLEGKTALVTGATRGIGAAAAEELLRLGAEVLVVARDPAGIEAFLAARASPRLSGIAADVSTPEGRAAVLARARARGRLDVLVNNAGTNVRKSTLESSAADLARLVAVNLESALELTRGAHPLLAAAGAAAVVNVGSVAGSRVVLTGPSYAVTKAGLEQLTRYLAVEWARDGVRVNAVLPWYTRTPLAEPVLQDPARLARILARTPLGRVAEPEEVARAIAFLALPAASYVTGACLPVDGGFLAMGL